MHDAQGMLKARVHGARIDIIGPRELPDAAKPLKCRLRNYGPLPVIERNEPVNRATDLVCLVSIRQNSYSRMIIGEQKTKINLIVRNA